MEKSKIRLNEKPTRLETLKIHLLLIILAGALGVFLPMVLSIFVGIVCIVSNNEASCQTYNSSEMSGYLVEMVLKIWHSIMEMVK